MACIIYTYYIHIQLYNRYNLRPRSGSYCEDISLHHSFVWGMGVDGCRGAKPEKRGKLIQSPPDATEPRMASTYQSLDSSAARIGQDTTGR